MKMRSLALLISWLALASPAIAAQGSGCVPTTGTVSGLAMAQNINTAIAALISSNSGASAPVTDCSATAVKGQIWLDSSVTPNALRQYDGVSTWVTIGYLDASNHLFAPPIGGGSSTVAAAATVDLGALPNAAVTISGTTPITSFGSSAVAGTIHVLTFSGVTTVTHNATSLIAPGGANITTAAGDVAFVAYLGGGNWRVIAYQTASAPVQAPAYTIYGNSGSSAANRADISIPALTLKASPVGADMVLLVDSAASNALKRTTLSAIAGVVGVTSYNGRVGAVSAATNDIPLPGYLSGLTLSAAGGTATFGVAAGVGTDSGNAAMMLLSSAFTKNTNAWVVGSGNGALDTSAIAINTWYHVFLMRRTDTGVVDICISLSTSACTTGGAIPSAYTQFRRIGSMKTDASSQWIKFIQVGDKFLWAAPPLDINVSNLGTSAATQTLSSVPTGIEVEALLNVGYSNASIGTAIYLSPLSVNDQAPSNTVAPGASLRNVVNSTNAWHAYFPIITNQSAQFRARSENNSTTLTVVVLGWNDRR